MRELRQRFWLRFTTWVTLSACFSVLAAGAVTAKNLQNLMTLWGDDIQITAYLASDVTADRIAEIQKKLGADPRVGRVEFVSREKALGDFAAQLASYAPDLAGDADLMSIIPASLQVSLSSMIEPGRQADVMKDVAQTAGALKGVEEVRYGQEWVKKYSAVVGAARGVFGFVGAVLVLAAFFVIGNAVRASVDSRRQEIEVLELVGATQWMIRRPYVLEGAVLGFLSSATALAIGAVLFQSVRGLVGGEMGSAALAAHLSYFSVFASAVFVAAGAAMGALSSYLCIRHVNTGFAAAGGRG